jgi:hypothetical protein
MQYAVLLKALGVYAVTCPITPFTPEKIPFW